MAYKSSKNKYWLCFHSKPRGPFAPKPDRVDLVDNEEQTAQTDQTDHADDSDNDSLPDISKEKGFRFHLKKKSKCTERKPYSLSCFFTNIGCKYLKLL